MKKMTLEFKTQMLKEMTTKKRKTVWRKGKKEEMERLDKGKQKGVE